MWNMCGMWNVYAPRPASAWVYAGLADQCAVSVGLLARRPVPFGDDIRRVIGVYQRHFDQRNGRCNEEHKQWNPFHDKLKKTVAKVVLATSARHFDPCL